jgi:hypothetical protein
VYRIKTETIEKANPNLKKVDVGLTEVLTEGCRLLKNYNFQSREMYQWRGRAKAVSA